MLRFALFLLLVATATAGERLTVPTPQEAVERMVQELEEYRRQSASSIVIPRGGAGGVGGPGGLGGLGPGGMPGGGKIQMP